MPIGARGGGPAAAVFSSAGRSSASGVAVREGFEPSIGFHLYTRSRRAPSTTRPPHQRPTCAGAFSTLSEPPRNAGAAPGRGEGRNIAMAAPPTSERERRAGPYYVNGAK